MSYGASNPARPDSWKTLPLPPKRELLPYYRAFTAGEMRGIAKGFVPSVMEEKWFACLDRDVLRLHRSWTGHCIYEVRLERDELTGGATVVEAYVNREPSQYTGDPNSRVEMRFLDYMIEYNLVGRDVPHLQFDPEELGRVWGRRTDEEQRWSAAHDEELTDIVGLADHYIPAYAVNDWQLGAREMALVADAAARLDAACPGISAENRAYFESVRRALGKLLRTAARRQPDEVGKAQASPSTPFPESYWVRRGRLLAGQYPGDRVPQVARERLRQLLDLGIVAILDLSHPEERLVPYESILRDLEGDGLPRVWYRHMPIRPGGIPSPERMLAIVDAIEDAYRAFPMVYVHCRSGLGRTATALGCFLARVRQSGPLGLAEIAAVAAGTPKGATRRTPETKAQSDLVRGWLDLDRRTELS